MTASSTPEPESPTVKRVDKYHVQVGTVTVVAQPSTEQLIRSLTPEQLVRFEHVMGGGR